MGQDSRGLPLIIPAQRTPFMDSEFNHAANDSPRSGSSKQVTPVLWAAIVAAVVAMAVWFALKA